MIFYIVTLLVWLAWLALGWFMPNWVSMKGKDVWFVRILFWLIGTVIAGIVVYLRLQSEKRKKALALAGEQGAELDFVLAEAEKKLKASGTSLSQMPVVFLMGARGAAKTSLMTKSGLEPELLSGLVYQEGNTLVQTRTANVWLAKKTVFVEAGPTLLENDKLWSAFSGRFAPSGMTALKAGAMPSPRSVVLFVGVEEFFQQNAGDAMTAKARILNQRLLEMSKLLGSRIPVYVVFSKSDQMPYFSNYVAYFDNQEAQQVFGATVPIRDLAAQGVYAEQAQQQLGDLYEELFRSLAERRVALQERDANQPGRPPVYEFPREFRKLRQAAVAFLVDVCRPSQLAVSPFIRGFYFSGVRPVLVSDAAGTQRRMPQWMFVTRFFSEVLLKDRAALGAASASTKTNLTRRLALGAVGALGLLAGGLFTASYFNNRELASELADASKSLRSVQVSPGEIPSTDNLNRLDRLRSSLEKLRGYQRDGAPLMLRWGLYTGEDLLPKARDLYFQSFRKVLFNDTENAILAWLRGLPAAPGPSDDYMTSYNALKAHLITRNEYKRSTATFLSPVLLQYWQGKKEVDPQRLGMVARQFEFYANELAVDNPFSKNNEATTVDRTRRFLKQFGADDRLYNAIIAEASAKNKAVNYYKEYPDGAKAMRVEKEVPGAFSREGFAWMQEALKNLQKYYGGEAWVLGDEKIQVANPAELEARLRARYYKDYSDQWKAYLKSASVLRYASLRDAAEKLRLQSGNLSPVLAAVFLASKHTAVAEKTISEQFQPAQLLTAPASTVLIGGENQTYMSSLLQLQGSIDMIAGMPASQAAQDPAAAQSLNFATAAKQAAGGTAQKFRPDPVDKVDQQVLKLMLDPITYVEQFLRSLGPAELNGAGAGFCRQFSTLISKYPFNPKSSDQATMTEFNGIFAPQTGALWVFYETKLKQMLVNQGGEYRAQPAANMELTPSFVAAFNRFASVTATAYGMNPTPSFRYTVRMNRDMKRDLKLNIDGQTADFRAGAATPKQFVWSGGGPGVRTTIGGGGGTVAFDGALGVFQWFNDAESWTTNSVSNHTVLWYQRSGTKVLLDDQGKPLSMVLDLEMPIPLFKKGYLAGLQCVGNVARSGN
jgi:type VI secretion system protein ImpL